MDRMAWIFGVLLFGVCLVAAEDIQEEVEGGKCERIKLPLCQDLGYNWTAMPNLLGHKDQKEAEEAMAAFADILESGCSEHSRFVVCSAFAPLCSEQVTGAVAACRALCERAAARDACGARLAAAGLPCAAFPLRADRRLCMRPPNASEREEPPPAAPVAHPAPWAPPALVVPGAALCPPVPSAGLALPALAWLSLLTTLAALLTFCAEPGRYRQPERPAVWLAACQLVVAAAHVARGWLGPATVCGGLAPGPTDGLGPPGCVAFFAVTYYFTLAADAWLANACGAWYLTAASEWSTEALERAAAYLHAVAWGWAGAWTAAALALRRVAAGAGGACGVADAAAAAQLLVPRAAPLLAALALGAAAAPGVRRVRRALGARGARRVGRLAARAAAVGLLYVLLAALSLGLRLVEARARVALSDAGGIAGPWSLAGSGPAAGAGSAAGVGSAAAALACGVVAAAWAWSRESAAAWRRALCPPRKARVLPPPLLPPPHPYCKRPLHVSRV